MNRVGQVHAGAIRRSPSAHLAAVADFDSSLVSPFVSEDGVRGYSNAQDLINDEEVGTVSLCLPHHLHYPLAMDAIAAGKNVLVEKPLAISLAECEQLVTAARQAGVALGVSHNQLFYSPYVAAKRMIDAGEIGRPVLLRLRLGLGPMYAGWRASAAEAGGGLLIDSGVHRLYVASFLFGPITSSQTILDVPRERSETFAVAVLQFASGARGIVEGNYGGPPGAFDDEIEVVGSDAVLRLPGVHSQLTTHDFMMKYSDRAWQRIPVDDDDWAGSVGKSVSAFLDALAAGQSPPVDGERALETMRLLYQMYDSAVLVG